VPLAWRDRTPNDGRILRSFAMAIALIFGIGALTIAFYCYTCARYEIELLPTLLLLAAIGILGLERTLVDRPVWRRTARSIWGVLLVFSVVFNLLASVQYHAEAHHIQGVTLFQEGKVSEAIKQYQEALRLYPAYAKAHLNLGIALEQTGRAREAIEQYEQALNLQPDSVKAQTALARLQASQ
jgi:tetratricopeptide (TPR) repeat protein